MIFVFLVFLAIGASSRKALTTITFPTSFTSSESWKVEPTEIDNCYRKGIIAVQNVADLVQKILIQENIIFSDKNWIVSPVSLAEVFAQILMSSRGEIRETLSDALSLAHEEQNSSKLEVHRQLGGLVKYIQHSGEDDYVLLLNGAFFLQEGFSLKSTYKHAIEDFYNTPIITIDFKKDSMKSTDIINQWIKNSTQNRFSDLISSPISSNAVSIMANIVYFKGSWEMPFDPDNTQTGLFFLRNNRKVSVDYMRGEHEVLYGNTSQFQLIGLPYKSREVVLYILIPTSKPSTRTAVKQFNSLASSAKFENVTLVLPKIKLTTTFSVKDAINKYLRKGSGHSRGRARRKSNKKFPRPSDLQPHSNGPNPRVDRSENFFDTSGASDDVRFRIDDVLQKASMQIDESGTELVSATSTLVDHSGSDLVLKVNRPFLFLVRHEITRVHLFWGFVTNPQESTKTTGSSRNGPASEGRSPIHTHV